MSRSNPTEGVKNPSTRWFTWAGGGDQGFIEWYDRDAKVNHKVEGAFTFLLLDELSTVKGWHEASESGIYANEVRDLRQEALVVKSFKGGELASGLYTGIRDSIIAKGGHYHGSIYIAYKDGDTLKLGNLGLKGAALSAWMEFKKSAPSKKDASGKNVKAYYVDAVVVTGFVDGKKGGTKFRTPVFSLKAVGEATNQQALGIDAELQAYFADYFKRPKAEAAKPANGNGFDDEPPFAQDEHAPAFEPEAEIPF
jgi:hypothetical protein